MKPLFAFAWIAALTGCATSSNPTSSPDADNWVFGKPGGGLYNMDRHSGQHPIGRDAGNALGSDNGGWRSGK